MCSANSALLYLLLLFTLPAVAQKQRKELAIRKAVSKIKTDGLGDDAAWKDAAAIGDFWQQFPHDSSKALTQTRVRATYDYEHLHFLIECTNRSLQSEYVVQTLKRDFDESLNDGVQIMLDPFDDQINGFSFSVSPYNVQAEGLIINGGSYGYTRNWDNRWYSQVQRSPEGWVAEIAIPFKTLRFDPTRTVWGLNVARVDLKNSEISVWCPVPRSFNLSSLAFAGRLVWDEAPKRTGVNVSLIPYGIGEANRDFQNGSPTRQNWNAGADAKVAISSSLNLDLTVNPDFSQADVDRQVTNLTRFSLYFPEQRQFFLENNDLFGQFGFSQIRPFFSRRVGLIDGRRVPIRFGARLSGKLDRNWRVGLMNITTGADTASNTPSENFTVACFQRQLKGRSNIGAIFVNRQSLDFGGDFNRVAGIDYKLASRNGKWNGIAFFHKSFNPGGSKPEDFAHASFLRYDDARWSLMWNHEYAGKNYVASTGFVPRQEQFNGLTQQTVKLSFWRLEPEAQFRLYPGGKISRVQHGVYASVYADSAYRRNETFVNFNSQMNFVNTAYVGVNANFNEIRLMYPMDITFTGGPLFEAKKYPFWDFGVYARSDVRKKLNARATLNYGGFYTGTKTSVSGLLQFRVPPWGLMGINYTRDELAFPGISPLVLNLIGPQLDLSFSRNLFFSSIVQYNDQAKNMSVFARLQWRFLPMSDVFLVYTENYQAPQLNVRNRAVVLKLVWWLTV